MQVKGKKIGSGQAACPQQAWCKSQWAHSLLWGSWLVPAPPTEGAWGNEGTALSWP